MRTPTIEYPALQVVSADPKYLHKERFQAVEISGTGSKDGTSTGIYRNIRSAKELVKDFPKVKTLVDVFAHGCSVNPKGPCLGWRPVRYDSVTKTVVAGDFIWQTYEQTFRRVVDFGCGVMKLAVDAGCSERFHLAVYSINNAEFAIADFAVQRFSVPLTTLYDTLGRDSSRYILNHSEVAIVVATIDKVVILLELMRDCPSVKAIIIMDGGLEMNKDQKTVIALAKLVAKSFNVGVFLFSEVESLGNAFPQEPRLPSPNDVAVISYTSGTTGNPKGALILHKNVVAVLRSYCDGGYSLAMNDVHLSYLPLAHIYERIKLNNAVLTGAAIGFSQGDASRLFDDIAALRPTVFTAVPRVLNRIYARIMETANTGSTINRRLFQYAVSVKLANLSHTGTQTHAVWDRVFFSRIRDILGGRVREIGVGSAPMSGEILRFMRIAFCCTVREGYGLTESTGCATACAIGDPCVGRVGPPATCVELKLVSVPDLKYTVLDKPFPRGEIWVRGSNVFAGYYKDEAQTNEVLTKDGWLKTGDIGSIDKKGRVSIIDRKKSIFKLSQGEYVAPEKLESLYQKSKFVAQVFIYGDPLKSRLVGIVHPNQVMILNCAREMGIFPPSQQSDKYALSSKSDQEVFAELCQNVKMKEIVLADLKSVARDNGARGYEIVKAIHLMPQPFSIENGLLTPTFKLRRREASVCMVRHSAR